jgi:hypothetical protein
MDPSDFTVAQIAAAQSGATAEQLIEAFGFDRARADELVRLAALSDDVPD